MGTRKPAEPRMSSGRVGRFNEYVEWRVGRHEIVWVAQRGSEGFWFVYEVHLGGKGVVKTLASFAPLQKTQAVEYARQQAENMFWG